MKTATRKTTTQATPPDAPVPVRQTRTRTFQPTKPVNELLTLGEELSGLSITDQINQTLALHLPALIAQRVAERQQRSSGMMARLTLLAKKPAPGA